MAEATSDHRTHDLDAIAASADGRALDDDSRRGAADGCTDCATLLADLRLLAKATASLSVPARPRDFRLDPADAARLSAMAPEPDDAAGRLGWQMTSPAADHAVHDPELVAAHVDGRLAASESARVDAWLAGCGACAALHRDLQDLVLATRALPTPARPRDFTLLPEDARRARAGGWRGLVAAIGSSRDTLTRPLAVGLTTLGIAGLIVANVPSGLTIGSASSGSATQVDLSQPSTAPLYRENAVPAPEADPSAAVDAAAGAPGVDITGEGAARPSDAAAAGGAAIAKSAEPSTQVDGDAPFAQQPGGEAPAGPSWLVIGSLALLVAGLALALARWRATRLGDG